MLKKLAISTLLLCPALSFALNKAEVQECFKKDIKKIETMTFSKPLSLDMFFLARAIRDNRDNYASELTYKPVDKKELARLDKDLQDLKNIISSAQTCNDASVRFTAAKKITGQNNENFDYTEYFDTAFALGGIDSISPELVIEVREALKESGYPTAAKQLARRHVFLNGLVYLSGLGSGQADGVDLPADKKLVTADQLEQSARRTVRNDQLSDTKDIFKTVRKILK